MEKMKCTTCGAYVGKVRWAKGSLHRILALVSSSIIVSNLQNPEEGTVSRLRGKKATTSTVVAHRTGSGEIDSR